MTQSRINEDVNWEEIDKLFLDMDGTLLDLHFDNYFWLHHVPEQYAAKEGITLEEASAELKGRYLTLEGSINWYCVDYWTEELGLDIALLKQEVDHLIQVHPHVLEFLEAVKRIGKRRVLVTNAHQKSLAIKLAKTPIGDHLDGVICSHDFGIPKEDPRFWEKLQEVEPFDKGRTVFVDDSVRVLDSAARYGIEWLVAIKQPDSKAVAPLQFEHYFAIDDFREIMP
ncbi:MAG: GMP/IMP nucleotidase [Gammaproteobacteria bacterium]|nr:GMP/IMP nucleotidase [Gammaproteobacteria bacterium]